MLTGRSWGTPSRSSRRRARRAGRPVGRVVTTLALLSATALVFWPSVAQADTNDTASGIGTISPNSWHCATGAAGSFELSATGTGVTAATGTFSFSCAASPAGYPAITFSGAVECLREQGTRAIIGGTVTATNEPVFPVGEALHFAVGDGGVGSGDAISDLYVGNTCDDNLPTNVPIVGEITLYKSPQCSDGRDNDGDGSVDYPADPGCTSGSDDTEAPNPTQCDDGVDNDGDGSVDYPADPGCTSGPTTPRPRTRPSATTVSTTTVTGPSTTPPTPAAPRGRRHRGPEPDPVQRRRRQRR